MSLQESPFKLPKPDLHKIRESVTKKYPELTNTFQSHRFPKTNRIAVINTANRPWSVIDSRFLATNLNAREFREFYFSAGGRPFSSTSTPIDQSVVCCNSVIHLCQSVESFSPSTIYLRVSPHTRSEFLISVFRTIFPKTRLLIETYDMSCLFDKKSLSYGVNNGGYTVERAIEGCAVALHYSDGIIAKMGGELFSEWSGNTRESFIPFFPTGCLEQKNTVLYSRNDKNARLRRIIYAGSASARELNKGIGSNDGANLISYFDRIANDVRFSLDIVNAAHDTENEDTGDKFGRLVSRYSSSHNKQNRVIYHRSMPLEKLRNFARQFDLGICCAHYANDKVENVTRISIPNRMTTYLGSDLPVIIDDRFEYAGNLLQSFNAGASVPAGDFAKFTEALATTDLKETTVGVNQLKHYMLEQNKKNMACLLQRIQ